MNLWTFNTFYLAKPNKYKAFRGSISQITKYEPNEPF